MNCSGTHNRPGSGIAFFPEQLHELSCHIFAQPARSRFFPSHHQESEGRTRRDFSALSSQERQILPKSPSGSQKEAELAKKRQNGTFR